MHSERGQGADPVHVEVVDRGSDGERSQARAWPRLEPVIRGLGGGAVLVIGAVHLREYRDGYAAIPTIGRLFLLNVAAAAVLGLVLLVPLRRVGGPAARAIAVLAAAGGFLLAATSLTLLVVAEHGSLAGFHEPGYDPRAIDLAVGAEIAAMALLGGWLVGRFTKRR